MSTPPESDHFEPSLWEQLGVPPPRRRDSDLAPEVDRQVLLRYIRRDLPVASARTVSHLIVTFKNWADAHESMLVEEFRRTGPHE